MSDQTSLDPDDWDDFRQRAHAALDAAISHMQRRADLPVWQQTPEDIRAGLRIPLPRTPGDPGALARQIETEFLPHDVGNTHPRFFGWVHGSGTPEGIIPEIFAAAMNANLGGRDHVANEVEKQVIRWCVEMFSFPETAGGLVVSGTSVATLIALKSARDRAMAAAGASGLEAAHKLVGYASEQAHGCIGKTFDILGLGRESLRKVPCDADFRMQPKALAEMIRQDLDAGLTPFCIIGTAGSVNVGAVDPLDTLARLAESEGLWFHVDGAFGATAILSPALAPRLRGIEQADSIAFDFHKWLHVNYDAGFVLMRDAQDQLRAFSDRPEYLASADRGLAAGNPWFCEYGPELSRGFRALKVWYQLARFGTDRLGRAIERNVSQAQYLGKLIAPNDKLELMAPVGLNIVCFRFNPGGLADDRLDRLNAEIVIRLQESGIAAPSTTRLCGRLAIRVNLTNHRTREKDLDILVGQVLALGARLT